MQKRLMSIILAVMLLAAMATTAGAATYEEINHSSAGCYYLLQFCNHSIDRPA